MVEGLGRGVELHDRVGARSGGGHAELEDAEITEPADEILRIHHLPHGIRIPLFGDGGGLGVLLAGDIAHGGCKGRCVGDEYRGVIADEFQKRHSVLAAPFGSGGRHDGDLAEPLLGKLRLYVEGAYGVYLVVEEVEAVGKFVGVGEDVEDGASAGELARFIHVVDVPESQFLKPVFHFGDVGLPGGSELKGALLQLLAHRHPLGKRVGVGDDPSYAPGPPAVDSLGAEYLLGRVDTPVFDVAFVAARKKRNLASGYTREVVVEISGGVGVIGHDHHRTLHIGHLSEKHGGRRPPESGERHATGLPVGYELSKGLKPRRSREERGGLAESHHLLRFAVFVLLCAAEASGVRRRMASYCGDSRMPMAASTTGSVRISTATRPPSP